MAENSSIEWTDHTFNPWIGCTRVSPGCDNCYAATQDKFRSWTPEGWGGPRRRTSPSTWTQPVRWNANHAAFDAEHDRRQRVFCASLGDVFDNQVPDEWRRDLFTLIESTPNLDWQLLTKRIGNVAGMLPWSTTAKAWPNVWIGATVVNQEEALRDIPKLLDVKARVRFLSLEPLLGPVDLSPWLAIGGNPPRRIPRMHNKPLHWAIIGGESGPGARSMALNWARGLVEQCTAAGVRTFVKQLGARPLDGDERHPITDRKGKHMHEWPLWLRVRQVPA